MLGSTVGLTKGAVGSIVVVEVTETVGTRGAIVAIAVVVFDGSVDVISKACKLGSSGLFWFSKLNSNSTIILKEAGTADDSTIKW